MIKKEIAYTDLNGVERKDVYYFHLSKADIAEMELMFPGGFSDHIQRAVTEDDRPALIKAFKELIVASIGERTEDGGFLKTDEYRKYFLSTEAYSTLFMELVTDALKSAEFFNGVFPADLAKKMAETNKDLEVRVPVVGGETIVMHRKPPEEYTRKELLEMPQDQFQQVVGDDPLKMNQEQLTIAYMRRVAKS